MNINGLPLFEALLEDNYDAVTAISFVKYPAVESLWQAFDKQDKKDEKKQVLFAVEDEVHHDVLGCVLRADYPIYRRDGEFEYYLTFSAETIEKFAAQILKDNSFKNIDLQHDGIFNVEGVSLKEMFIKNTEKGINPNGFEDIADGSLFARFHVDSIDLWSDIQEGKFQGFSVEAWLSVKEVDNNDNKNENMSKIDKVKDLMNSLFSALNEALSEEQPEEEVAQSAPSNEIATEETVEEETEETIEFIPDDEETEEIEEEQSEDTDEDFEARIAELQSQIEALTNTNTQLSSQIEELKKTAPSLTELSKNEVNTETRKTGTMLDYLAAIKR